MSKICGIEIKSKTATLLILEGTRESYSITKSTPLKIELLDHTNQESMKSFRDAMVNFFATYNVKKVILKESSSKGKFSSGAPVFKIETIIQLSDVSVEFVKARTLSSFLKKEELDMEELALKKYQHGAFEVAYYGLEE